MGGEITDTILRGEVDIIYIRKDKYGEREHIAKNDDFSVNVAGALIVGSDI